MITYADVELVGESEELEMFVSNHIPYDWCHFFLPHPEPVANESRDLPCPNYSKLPPFRFNMLYWPTGAARWGCIVVLVNRDRLDAIIELATDSEQVAKNNLLTIGDGNRTQSFEMWMLPPHPIMASSEPLWAVPLVDGRYFWWFRNVGTYAPTTWTEAFDDATSPLSLDVAFGYTVPDSDWGIPDPTELTREYHSVPVLLDCVAHSTGTRVVFHPDGSAEAVSVTESETELASNLDLPGDAVAGNVFSDIYRATVNPSVLKVTFPKYRDHHEYSDGEVHTEDESKPQTETLEFSATKTIRSTAFADYTGGSHSNATEVSDLSAVIATAYYGWTTKLYDYVYAGVVNWVPTGFDDYILWQVSPGKAYTRVVSQPFNFCMDHQLQQFSGKTLYGDWIRGTLDGSLADAGTATLSITTWGGSSWSDSGDNVTIREAVGLDTSLSTNDVVHAYWHEQSNQWIGALTPC